MKRALSLVLLCLLAAGCSPASSPRFPDRLLAAPFTASYTLSTGQSGVLEKTAAGAVTATVGSPRLTAPLSLSWADGGLTAQLGDQTALLGGAGPDCALPRLVSTALEAAQSDQAQTSREDGALLLTAPSLLGEVRLAADEGGKILLWLEIPSQQLSLRFSSFASAG